MEMYRKVKIFLKPCYIQMTCKGVKLRKPFLLCRLLATYVPFWQESLLGKTNTLPLAQEPAGKKESSRICTFRDGLLP